MKRMRIKSISLEKGATKITLRKFLKLKSVKMSFDIMNINQSVVNVVVIDYVIVKSIPCTKYFEKLR